MRPRPLVLNSLRFDQSALQTANQTDPNQIEYEIKPKQIKSNHKNPNNNKIKQNISCTNRKQNPNVKSTSKLKSKPQQQQNSNQKSSLTPKTKNHERKIVIKK
eukprot:gnl/MRDRNA2_/MRDRNA2_83431_c0_seq1.p1 gnl/MRDRNA2_/MRDRNA2_83431_c0~~gnl/MRDRNA2_/MRDRNA2_83431_c0_seq1.p1  ORF type:complete len:103 (+),score=12.45 gnl/MRDRNA2_/MRDRNA2_83431_c0_seq1:108-416(+)